MDEENNHESQVVDVSIPPIGSASPEIVEQPKSKKNVIIVIVSILFVVLIGVGLVIVFTSGDNDKDKNKDTGKPTETIDTDADNYKTKYTISKNSIDDFDIAFLKLENNKNNMIYSPLSIKYALGMLMQGASGETLTQINNVIGQYKFHKFTNNKYMSFANALFIKNTYKNSVNTTYVANLKDNFGAEVKYDSFKKPDTVNKYVSEKTFNLVNNIVDNIKDNDYILLNALAINMNWVKRIQPDYNEKKPDNVFYVKFDHMKYNKFIDYLNMTDYHELSFNNDPVAKQSVEIGAVINNYDIVGTLGKDKIKKIVMDDYKNWKAKGAPDACEDCNDDGDCVKDTSFDFEEYYKELSENYKYVNSSTDFEFYVDDNIKVFRKDLKKYEDTKLSYLAIMPTKESLDSYISKISANDINELKGKLKSIKLENFKEGVITEISGYIPLFNFDYELDLMKDLNEMGIVDVFDAEKADLSNLSSSKTFINKTIHKANIDFSNEGIKAAATTLDGGMGGGDCGYDYLFVPPVEKIDLTFDKPFLFIIFDKSTEEVWFTGRVYEPSKYKSYEDIYYDAHPNERDLDD